MVKAKYTLEERYERIRYDKINAQYFFLIMYSRISGISSDELLDKIPRLEKFLESMSHDLLRQMDPETVQHQKSGLVAVENLNNPVIFLF